MKTQAIRNEFDFRFQDGFRIWGFRVSGFIGWDTFTKLAIQKDLTMSKEMRDQPGQTLGLLKSVMVDCHFLLSSSICCVSIYIYTCMCVCIYIYTYTYTCIISHYLAVIHINIITYTHDHFVGSSIRSHNTECIAEFSKKGNSQGIEAYFDSLKANLLPRARATATWHAGKHCRQYWKSRSLCW